MSCHQSPDSKLFLIGGRDDLRRAFQFARVTRTRARLMVCGNHLLFWKHQNFSTMIAETAKTFEPRSFQLIVDVRGKISLVLYALQCEETSALLCTGILPLGDEIAHLVQKRHIAILERLPP